MRQTPRNSRGEIIVARTSHASKSLEAPTATRGRRTRPASPTAPDPRASVSPAVVVAVAATGLLVLLVLGIVAEAVSGPAPAPMATPAVSVQLSQSDRTDAMLKGLSAGLNYRSTWGDDLTRENITQPCATQASLAYRSSFEAADVFTTACVNNALGRTASSP